MSPRVGPWGAAALGALCWCLILGVAGRTIQLGAISLLLGAAVIWIVEELLGPGEGPSDDE